jgi:hypothetical protein
MERWNSEALPRDKLKWALTQRSIVSQAREQDSCLLCCSPHVNEAALCGVCWALLDEEELKIATKWVEGSGP